MGPETLADLDPRQAPVRMPSPSASPLLPGLARACLAAVALACVAAAGLVLLAGGGDSAPVAVLYFALAAVAAALMRLPGAWLGHGLTGLLTLLTLTLGASAFRLGWGLSAPGLSLMGLVVCLLCATVGWRAGAALATLAVLLVSALALGVPTSTPLPGMPGPLLQLGTHLIAIGAGLAGGVMISRWMSASRHNAQTRERRFKSLLGLAADGYWEIDDRYRLVSASGADAEPQPLIVEVTGDGRLGYSEGPVTLPDGRVPSRYFSTWRLEADGRWRVAFDNGYDLPQK